MKILIIGYCPQRFMNPVANELQKKGHVVDLFSFRTFDLTDQERSYYDQVINGMPSFNRWSKFANFISGSFLYGYWMVKFLLQNRTMSLSDRFSCLLKGLANHPHAGPLRQYDLINIQMMAPMDAFFPFLSDKSKLVCSYWGSDLLQASWVDLNKQKKWLLRADRITVQSDELKMTLLKKHEPKILKRKIHQTLYPTNQSIVQTIINRKADQQTNVEINITIGYNASDNQNHLLILNQIDKLPLALKAKSKLYLQLSYGGTEAYINSVLTKLESIGVEYETNRSFITDEQMALKRLSSDIFIHLPKTDAFCAALSESLVAQNIVITGQWLPYSLYDQNKVNIYKLQSINELAGRLESVLLNIAQEKQDVLSNTAKVLEIIDHKKAVNNWVSILENV